ncbi:hypothetical protein GCM10010285_63010 [Streptomyces pseudogriseolus]|uniref:Uncharacterized protein n=1 Tax=Streptomyces pseudogriseolus TaxID=36817 RepID=A0ABQ2TMN7_STREZ|nr:hypothetical protein GCM10010285_63010 [Streptomyces rubiginosus]
MGRAAEGLLGPCSKLSVLGAPAVLLSLVDPTIVVCGMMAYVVPAVPRAKGPPPAQSKGAPRLTWCAGSWLQPGAGGSADQQTDLDCHQERPEDRARQLHPP